MGGGRDNDTHLNTMSGGNHHPGLAVAALGDDEAYVELIADRQTSTRPSADHHPNQASRPADALQRRCRCRTSQRQAYASGPRSSAVGFQPGRRWSACGDRTDSAVHNMAQAGILVPAAVAAASANPAAMLEATTQADRRRPAG